MTNNSEQLSLINEQPIADNAPVVCLGMTFENEEARRDYFREELRKKLPELKQIEGFPIGEDEDIIALSDPPYYTACPNPWVTKFIEGWGKDKITKHNQEVKDEYNREPFVVDVSEGKYDKSYKFHPYATKVPHKAIMRYLLHYTKPGDIIMDSFSGTGMSGVATQLCNSKEEVEALGYVVDENGKIYEEIEGINGAIESSFISNLGEREIILNDLSAAASFISNNFNVKDSDIEIEQLTSAINSIQQNIGWMFKTLHQPNSKELEESKQIFLNADNIEKTKNIFDETTLNFGEINFVAWSDVFICPVCSEEIVYWNEAVEEVSGKIHDNFSCPSCGVNLTKNTSERAWVNNYDFYLDKVISQSKQVPVIINYSVGNKTYTKKPDEFDKQLLHLIDKFNSFECVPVDELPDGDETNRPKKLGITHVHQFYTNRNLAVLASLVKDRDIREAGKIITRVASRITKMYGLTYQSGKWGAGGGPLSGTFYIPSLTKELNMIRHLNKSLKTQKTKDWAVSNNVIQSISSSTNLKYILDESIDYIFIDPPFGGNLMYSELNYIWEAWLKVHTRNNEEAIVSQKQSKNLDDYKHLMAECFKEAYRVLKSGRWMTVEFSNTKASVWNVIQSAITDAGFVVANVSALDKKKGSFKVITSTTAVKQDLVISAYKPSIENINKMREQTNTPESSWIFVNQHLEKLPVFFGSKGEAGIIAERTPRILFDRMIAYHVQNGLPVPISSAEFQIGVTQRFPMRDGMAFLESQVAEYDKKRTLVKDFSQMNLFVSDENSAIEWLRQQLMKKPQSRQDLHPQFMREIQHIAKHEQLPEIDDLLVQNFLRYEGDTSVPDQIAGYLRRNYREHRGLDNDNDKLKVRSTNCWYVPDPNKQADLEKLREKTLLREFESYVEELGTNKKKLSHFRTEAVRAGFKKAWTEKDYNKIVTVGDRLPETVIQEDDKLLMYYDNAQIRIDM